MNPSTEGKKYTKGTSQNSFSFSTEKYPTPNQISKSENRQGIDSYLNILPLGCALKVPLLHIIHSQICQN